LNQYKVIFMHTLISSKFVEKEGYLFDIIQTDIHCFEIFNTRRKRNQTDRDGLGYCVAKFDSLVEAKKYINNLIKE
jgi:hypothetical protein